MTTNGHMIKCMQTKRYLIRCGIQLKIVRIYNQVCHIYINFVECGFMVELILKLLALSLNKFVSCV